MTVRMTNEDFVTSLQKLISNISHSKEHAYTVAILKECCERIDSIKHLETENQYYKELNTGYEKLFAEYIKGGGKFL